MGLPKVEISFRTAAAAAVKRSKKGVVGIILRDANQSAGGAWRMTGASDIPSALGADNKGCIERAFAGYISPPREVLAFVLGADEELSAALAHFATVEADYLCGPPACTEGEAGEIAAWVKGRRAQNSTVKAVLPNQAADTDGVVNFASEGIRAGGSTYTAAGYCSRVAGLIAGTPMTISCTYAPLPEVTDVARLSPEEMDAAIDQGKLMLYHDGEKVKIARGVNSLVTTTRDKGEAFKKLKLVETVDMLGRDIRRTAEDSYIGKYSNSYDNKCLLITAIKGYLETLEAEGILDPGKSTVGIDLTAQENYLKSTGVDTAALSEQEIKEANTADRVFLAAGIKILDAIEDISLDIVI